MSETENLSSWLDSGEPYRFVWDRLGAWADDEYAGLLASLQTGPYWPMIEDDVVKTLEEAKKTYVDLER